MNGKDFYKLLEAVESRVEKRTAKICIMLANQHENGKEIAKEIAEKFDIEAFGISEQTGVRTLEEGTEELQEVQRRAEVAEQQAVVLSKWLAEKTRKDYPWRAWFDAAQKQVEKELAEEERK